MNRIESSSNAKIKRIQKLMRNARLRRQEKLFVTEGWKMTEEALTRGLVREIYLSDDATEEWEKRNLQGKMASGCPVWMVAPSVFRELSDTVSPQGILALVEMPQYDRSVLTGADDAALLILEDVQDPGNLGTMIRTAEGAGMSGVVMSRGCVDIFNPKVVRSTMGALFRVPFYICDDLVKELCDLRNEGFTTYAAHLLGTCDFTEESYKGKTGILIGNEANGLSDAVSSQADRLVKIPMEGELESLNAAVSAALFMYEVHRKR